MRAEISIFAIILLIACSDAFLVFEYERPSNPTFGSSRIVTSLQSLLPENGNAADIYCEQEGGNEDISELLKSFPELSTVQRFLASYDDDMLHDGRFGVTGTYSLPANLIFSMDDPLSYLQQVLTDSLLSPTTTNDQDSELAIFCPGLYTPLSEATQQKDFLSRVLGNVPLALLHVGSQRQQSQDGPTQLFVSETLQLLEHPPKSASLPSSLDPSLYGNDLLRAVVNWNPKSIERKEKDDDALVQSLVKLIDTAVASVVEARDDDERHSLVLISYSATSRALATAIAAWKETPRARQLLLKQQHQNDKSLEQLLHDAITVVTLSGLCAMYPKGPAYIHVTMHDDDLAATLGAPKLSTAAEDEDTDAVWLLGISPYLSSPSNEQPLAHNPEAAAIQFLSLVMRINGIRSFRQLYDLGNQPAPKLDIAPKLYALNYLSSKAGALDLPSDELLAAMVRATMAGGDHHRWLNDDNSEGDEDLEEVLPDLVNAEATISEHFGHGVFDEILESVRRSGAARSITAQEENEEEECRLPRS